MNIGAMLGIFALMFLLELPDKTMIATIVMSTRARPSSVILGASSAFIVHMAIAVTAGGLLTLLPGHIKDTIVGLLFLGGAAYLFFVPEEREEAEGAREAEPEHAAGRWREIATAFGIIFIGEFGDLTQIQAANLAARTHQPYQVFAASSAALVCVTVLGAYGGRMLQRFLPLKVIRGIGGLIFTGLGIYTLVSLCLG